MKDSCTAFSKDGGLNALFVVMTVYGLIQMGGPTSGAAYNPAVALAISIVGNTGEKKYKYLWIYFASGILGAIISGIF